MKREIVESEYIEQQRALDEIAGKLGVVAYRPDYHRKDRDKNTVLFYTREDEEHNRLVDKQLTRYTASEAADRMKYNRVEIPPVFRFGNDLAPDQRRRGTRFGNVLNPVAESTGIEQNENNDEHIENYCIPEGTPVTPVIFFQLKRKITEFIAYAVVHSTASRYPATPLLSFRR